jgi:hypothetical protein
MQVGEAARHQPGPITNTRAQRAQGTPDSPAARSGEIRRDLDSLAAGRVLAASVLERIAVIRAARVEHSAGAGVRPQAESDPAGSVASALRSAVAASGAPAESLVRDLLDEVDAGIASARSVLARMGYDPKQVAAAALQFRERVGARIDSYAAEPAATADSAQVSAAHVRKERGRIELVTQDGDVVRIGFRVRDAERVTVAGVRDADGSAFRARIASDQSMRFAVSVHGELDAGELKAIEEFIGKVDALATSFYDGDVEAAFAAAAGLHADPEEIVRYGVELSVRERYAMRAQLPGAPLPKADAAAAAPPDAAVTPGPSVTPKPAERRAPDANTVAPAAQASAEATVHAEDMGAAAAGQAQGAGSANEREQPASGLDTIRRFVKEVLETARTPLSVYGAALQWAVKLELTEALLDKSRPDERPRPGADMLVAVMHTAADVAELKANPAAVYVPVRIGTGRRGSRVTRD